jgi:hypothetical protein
MKSPRCIIIAGPNGAEAWEVYDSSGCRPRLLEAKE